MSLADPGDSGFDDRGYARPRRPHRGRGACRRSCRHALATHFGTGPGAGADRRLCRRDDRSTCGRRMNRSRTERRRNHSEAPPGRGFIIRNSHGTGCPVGQADPGDPRALNPIFRLSPADHESAISTGPRRRIAWRRCPRTQGPLPAVYVRGSAAARHGREIEWPPTPGRRRKRPPAEPGRRARHLMASGRRTGVPTMTLPAPQPLCTV